MMGLFLRPMCWMRSLLLDSINKITVQILIRCSYGWWYGLNYFWVEQESDGHNPSYCCCDRYETSTYSCLFFIPRPWRSHTNYSKGASFIFTHMYIHVHRNYQVHTSFLCTPYNGAHLIIRRKWPTPSPCHRSQFLTPIRIDCTVGASVNGFKDMKFVGRLLVGHRPLP